MNESILPPPVDVPPVEVPPPAPPGDTEKLPVIPEPVPAEEAPVS